MKKRDLVLLIMLVFIAILLSMWIIKTCISNETQKNPEVFEESFSATETLLNHDANDIPEGNDITVMIATDFHFLSSELTDSGSAALEVSGKEGQLSQYSDVILDEFIKISLDLRPDIIVIPGDLAFRGEQASLKELAKKYQILTHAGIPVIVIPGNHDIESDASFLYKEEEMIQVDNISSDEFLDIMEEFGYQQALSIAPDSLSYIYKYNENLAFLCLDANTTMFPFEISKATLDWADEELDKLKDDGLQIIGMTHQNILIQNSFRYEKIAISNASDVLDLYNKYDIKTNLCGHFHVTHHAKQDGITEYCTGAICIYPLCYATLNISKNQEIIYKRERMNILHDESLEVLRKGFSKRIRANLEDVEALTTEELDKMTDYALNVIEKFYDGTLDKDNAMNEDAWLLWEEHCQNTWWFQYLESILTE